MNQNTVYPVAWYLDHAESLGKRKTPTVYKSDKLLGWTYASNVRKKGFSTNSGGLRGKREYYLFRRQGILRGIVLGDSFSAGYGVADNETYAAQLENILPSSEFPNLAVPGYGVDQAILRWEKIGRAYKPDVVILAIFLPDFHRNALTRWFDAPKPRFKVVNGVLELPTGPLPPIENVFENEQRARAELEDILRVPRVWVASTYLLERVARTLRDGQEADNTFLEKRLLLDLLIRRLADDCRERGARLAVVNILTQHSDYQDEDRILSIIKQSAIQNDAAVLTLDRFLGTSVTERATTPLFDPITKHWSAYAHRRAAQLIAVFLAKEGMIERP